MSIYYVLGLAVGILLTVIVVLVIKRAVTGTWFKCDDKYDERQQAAKSKGYQIGFYTMLCYFMVLEFVTMSEIELPMPFFIFLGIVISAVTFAVYCIIKGAYIGYNQNIRKVSIMLGAIMILNIIPAIEKMIHGETAVEKFCNVNLLCAVMLLVVLTASLLKNMLDKRTGEEN